MLRLTCRKLRRSFLLVVFTVCLTACAGKVSNETGPDYSNLAPADVLDIFLENERSKGTVKFVFDGDIEVKAGGSHHFRGVAGVENCYALRIKLLGPVGFTLLEYLYVGNNAQLIVDEVSPDGDDDARVGLMSLMEAFTLSLLERCQPALSFNMVSGDSEIMTYAALSRLGSEITYTLDRKTAVLLQQSLPGRDRSMTVVDYHDYGWTNEKWMPGRIEISGLEMPVTIGMQIKRWTVDADLPEAFFDEQ